MRLKRRRIYKVGYACIGNLRGKEAELITQLVQAEKRLAKPLPAQEALTEVKKVLFGEEDEKPKVNKSPVQVALDALKAEEKISYYFEAHQSGGQVFNAGWYRGHLTNDVGGGKWKIHWPSDNSTDERLLNKKTWKEKIWELGWNEEAQ